jgi:hypothetical protein
MIMKTTVGVWMARMTCGLGVLVPLVGTAQDRAELDRSRIVGNRELPKVLYIVPWKKPLPDELSGKPVTSVLDEVLAPIDRDVHRRQVNYHARVVSAGLAPLSTDPRSPNPSPPAAKAVAPVVSPSTSQPQLQDKKP